MEGLKKYLSPVIAGMLIAFGGCVYLLCDVKIIGATLFAIGLFTIVNYGFDLYTGKVCYSVFKDYNGMNPIIIWILNFVGTFIVAFLLSKTRIAPTLIEKSRSLCDTKLSDSYLSLFILGIFCNIMIYIGVDGFKNGKSDLAKTLFVFLGVIVFIISGFEHSVADMFYFSMAGLINIKSLIALIVISLGNAVGGIGINFLFRQLKK